ncbi:carbonic anhydrase 4-like [Carcharodon carcharias]|uniref:carbonic anhydrase 4-like n=1 Tax=Carcharodon carcharias TaxID=13397 RepID=UPI001B7E355D|nr:carbonic anhydrase 4-like [Carcharodon carcharias]
MLFVLLGLGLSQVESATDGFCYYQTSCGPTSWPVTYPTCQGTEQSPINIQKNRTIRDEHLGEFKFHQYDNRQFLTQIKHTKMSVKVRVKPGMELSGGGLRAVYLVSQFHLHWGQNISAQGSEHMLDGKRASMELHIVHRQTNLTLEEAFKHRQGLAVLAFFIEIESGIAEDPAWRNLTRTIKYLKEDGDHYDLNETVSLMDLINTVNHTKYYRYNGSLTTPECNEVVVWTVFEEPIHLNASLVECFFEYLHVNHAGGDKLVNNFRPVQSNGNPVLSSPAASRGADIGPTRSPAGGTHGGDSTPQQLMVTTSGSARRGPLFLVLLLPLAGLFLRPV